MGFSGCPRDITSKAEALARTGFGAISASYPRDIASHRYVTSLAVLRDIASQGRRAESPASPAGTEIQRNGEVAPSSSAFRFSSIYKNLVAAALLLWAILRSLRSLCIRRWITVNRSPPASLWLLVI